MKKILTMLVVVSSVATILHAQDSERKKLFVTDDEKAIRDAGKNYYRGVINADRTRLEAAWAVDDAFMQVVNRDKEGIEQVLTIPIATALDWWTETSARTSKGEVLLFDIVDNKMAFLKFSFTFNEKEYIDYLTLMKINGEWKIIHKTYVARKK